jgi:hypothetical protein
MLNVSNASAKEIAQEVVGRAIESKSVAVSIAAGTAALGLSEMQSYAQLFATIAAGVLSLVLAIKHGLDAYRKVKNEREESEKD